MAALAVLRPGDWVRFDGGEHEVLAVAGTSVRLRSAAGSHSVVLASYLMAAPDFAVTGEEPMPEVEPFGLLDSLPEDVLAAAAFAGPVVVVHGRRSATREAAPRRLTGAIIILRDDVHPPRPVDAGRAESG